MIQYPLSFEAVAKSNEGIASAWSAGAPSTEQVTMAIPPEFEGPGGGFSPEDLYAMALSNCFVATFKVIAERSRVTFGEIRTRSRLIVDRDEAGRPWMSKLELQIEVTEAKDVDRMRRLLEKTSGQCMILNSVKTEIVFDFLVS